MSTVRIAAAQTEYLEDMNAALQCIADVAARAGAEGATLVVFPEAFLQGYLTEPDAARRNALDLASPEFGSVLARLPRNGPMLVIGLLERQGDNLFNTAIVVQHGVILGRYRKVHLLPGESSFVPGSGPAVFEIDGLRFGITICYDTNFPEAARDVAALGATLVVCPANNMMPRQRAEAYRELHNAVRGERCRETGLWLISADVAGERDGRLALGPTAVLDPDGQVVAQLPLGEVGLLLFDLPLGG